MAFTNGGVRMKWLFRWMFEGELIAEYIRGWGAGVDQQRKEPDTCDHHETVNYWGEEE
jgi:hypothetical protein